jgi:two-component system, NarL family, nitrate/nitrite response regulator NarL
MGRKMRSSAAKAQKIIRVVLAGRTQMDCQMLATSLQNLNRRCKVVGCAVNASGMRAILKEQRPEIAVVSPSLEDGPLAGFDLMHELRDSFPATRAVMLLDSMEPRMVIYSFQVGAKGIFSRDKSLEALSKCIEVIHGGQIWVGTGELQMVLEAMAKRSHFEPLNQKGTKVLTNREAEVASLVAEGLKNREISERLNLSAHTVKNYLYRVYDKLGIATRVELANHVLARDTTEPHNREPVHQTRLAG